MQNASNIITDTQIKAIAKDLQFTLCAVTPATKTAYQAQLKQWLKDKKQGQMHYLENHFPQRTDPNILLPGAKYIICLADQYPNKISQTKTQNQNPQALHHASPAKGKIARYAWGEDYHNTIKTRLHQLADTLALQFPGHQFKSATDTAPILEREHATRAGLGWTGKNTLLINPNKGSYLLLGQIVTTLPISIAQPAIVTDHCGSCTKCIQACPTQAIDPAGYTMDGSKCISYLTLEYRDIIPQKSHQPIGQWIAGCDICQEVCPHNHPETLTKKQNRYAAADTLTAEIPQAYQVKPLAQGLSLLDILHWQAEDRLRVFKKSALKRMKLHMVQRNALVAAGNDLIDLKKQKNQHAEMQNDRQKLYEKIKALASDDQAHEMVSTTAQQVLTRLDNA